MWMRVTNGVAEPTTPKGGTSERTSVSKEMEKETEAKERRRG